MRLPRKLSLTQRADFSRVKDHGDSRPGRYLVLSVLRSEALDHLRVGYITTKKVGKAHERNLIRRRLRAIVQEFGDQIDPQQHIVTIARWRAKEASYEELKKDWLKQAKRLGVLKSKESKS